MADPYNAGLLDKELRAAGLSIHGCDSTGQISWVGTPSAANLATATTVIAAHDPNKPNPMQVRLAALRAKRRANQPLTPVEQSELLDILLGV